MKKQSSFNSLLLLFLTVFFAVPDLAISQTLVDATNNFPRTPDHVNVVRTLNCDIVNAPHAQSSRDYVRAIVWEGDKEDPNNAFCNFPTGPMCLVPDAKLYINAGWSTTWSLQNSAEVFLTLPSGALNPDVAIAEWVAIPDAFHFLVTYELNGEIWLDVYAYIVSFSSPSYSISNYPAGATTALQFSTQITNTGGQAHRPKIDLHLDPLNSRVSSNGGYLIDHNMSSDYTITWYEYQTPPPPATAGNYVCLITGTPGNPPAGSPITIARGINPDVAVYDYDAPFATPSGIVQRSIVTYLEDASPSSELYYVVGNDYVFSTPVTLEDNTTAQEIGNPSAEAMSVASSSSPPTVDEWCISAPVVPIGGGAWQARAYTSIGNTINCGSSLSTGDDFLMPVVTAGTGTVTGTPFLSQGSTPTNDNFGVSYYSTYTHLNTTQPNPSNTNGDFFSTFIEALSPNNIVGSPDYYEINHYNLDMAYNSNDGKSIASASPRGTGDGHLTVWFWGEPSRGYNWYGGADLVFNTSGSSFTGMYKPTEVSSIHRNTASEVYPIPATDIVHVLAHETAEYTLSDLTGRKVLIGTLSEGDNRLDIAKFTTGVYILNIENAQQETFKLIKK